MKKIYSKLTQSLLISFCLICFATTSINAQTCDNPLSYNTDEQPTYSGLTGWIAEIFNNIFGARGKIINRQNGIDNEGGNYKNPQTSADFYSPAASWSGGLF